MNPWPEMWNINDSVCQSWEIGFSPQQTSLYFKLLFAGLSLQSCNRSKNSEVIVAAQNECHPLIAGIAMPLHILTHLPENSRNGLACHTRSINMHDQFLCRCNWSDVNKTLQLSSEEKIKQIEVWWLRWPWDWPSLLIHWFGKVVSKYSRTVVKCTGALSCYTCTL